MCTVPLRVRCVGQVGNNGACQLTQVADSLTMHAARRDGAGGEDSVDHLAGGIDRHAVILRGRAAHMKYTWSTHAGRHLSAV